jgi:hypothetical protein
MKKIFLVVTFFFLYNGTIAQDWIEPVCVSNRAGEDQSPDFCIDSEGIIHCVWVHVYEWDYSVILYSHSDDGGLSWSTMNISLNTEKRLSEPHIVCGSDNTLHVTYDYDVFHYPETLVLYKSFDGQNWSEAFVVSENLPESHANKLAIDNNNRLYCFWYMSHNNGTTYYRYKDGNVWSGLNIPYPGDFYLGVKDIAIDKNNNLHCIGTYHNEGQSHNEDRVIYVTSVNNAWSSILEISNYTISNGKDIDIDGIGFPHLTWRQKNPMTGSENDSTMYVSFNGVSWSTPELIVEDPIHQQIAIDENNKPNIFDVEKTDEGSMLVWYYKNQDIWEGFIIDESDWFGMSPVVSNYNKQLYILYEKATDSTSSEIYFSKAGIVNSTAQYNNYPLSFKTFPNPFSHELQIDFTTKEKSFTTLRVYDLQGRLVTTLLNETLIKGNHKRIWNRKNQNGLAIKPGFYLIRLQNGRNVYTRSVEFINN